MGNCYAQFYKKKFIVDENIEGQGNSASEVFALLGLTTVDVDLLYTAFWDIDADGSGLIRPGELFSYFEVEGTKFERGVFSLFDEDNSGMINFMEFVCTLWNLLTLPESDYGSLAFLIKDPTAVGTINYADVRELLEMMHCKKIDRDPALQGVYLKMRKELGNAFTIHEFNKWTAANSHVVTPIMMLQLHIRLQIIGEPFWAKLAIMRKEHQEQGQLDYVKKLQDFVITKNEAFKQKLLLQEAERRRLERLGRGKMGDCRDNVTRKQSVLLGYFNMKQAAPPPGIGRQGKSLSRLFVLSEDADDPDDDAAISGGQSSSAKQRSSNGGSSNTSAKAASQKVSTTDPFLESDIRNNSSTPANTPANVNGKQDNPQSQSKVRTVIAIKGDNRRRRSSITLQKPNLVRDLVDKKKKKEDKYKDQIGQKKKTKSSKEKKASDSSGKKSNKNSKKVAPTAAASENSDNEDAEDD